MRSPTPTRSELPREFRHGEVIRLVIHGASHEGYHTYPLTRQFKQATGNSSALQIEKNDALEILWPPTETPQPTPVKEIDDNFYLEHKAPFTWTQYLYIKPDAKPQSVKLHFKIDHVQVCNDGGCYGPAAHEFEIPFTIIDAPVVPPPADLEQRLQFTPPPPETLNFQGKDSPSSRSFPS